MRQGLLLWRKFNFRIFYLILFLATPYWYTRVFRAISALERVGSYCKLHGLSTGKEEGKRLRRILILILILFLCCALCGKSYRSCEESDCLLSINDKCDRMGHHSAYSQVLASCVFQRTDQQERCDLVT